MGRKPVLRPCGCRTSKQVGKNGSRYSANHRRECPLAFTKGQQNHHLTQSQINMKKNAKLAQRKARKLLNKNKMIEAFDISEYSFNIIPHDKPEYMRHLRALNFSYARLSPKCLICQSDTVYSYDIKTNKVLCDSCFRKKVIQ